jgi:hypothetical protein
MKNQIALCAFNGRCRVVDADLDEITIEAIEYMLQRDVPDDEVDEFIACKLLRE